MGRKRIHQNRLANSNDIPTIRIKSDTKNTLKLIKNHPKETFSDVVDSLVDFATQNGFIKIKEPVPKAEEVEEGKKDEIMKEAEALADLSKEMKRTPLY